MKWRFVLLLSILLMAAFSTLPFSSPAGEEDRSCNFFLVKESGDGVVVEKATLSQNELKVFRGGGILSYIAVFPPGSKSGNLITSDQRIDGLIARYAGDKIEVKVLREDGSQKDMPDIDLAEAAETDIRLNITGAGGYQKAYLIERYSSIREDQGPVLDMFAGHIELNRGDYSFMTECMESRGMELIHGAAPYQIHRGWITVLCRLPGGREGRFVVDFGAATTVIPKGLLPGDAEISKLEMVEYSSEGEKRGRASVPGASGMVENIAGVSVLEDFGVGDIMLEDFKVTVMSEFPEPFVKAGIDGVLGRDMLMKAGVVEVVGLKGSDQDNKLVFTGGDEDTNRDGLAVPFSFAGGGQIYIDGSISGTPIQFLLDTGSGSSVLNREFLEERGISYSASGEGKRTAYGIDGKGIEYETVELNDIEVGKVHLETMEFNIHDVHALSHGGAADRTGLLGMDFLRRYSRAAFDFNSSNLVLWE